MNSTHQYNQSFYQVHTKRYAYQVIAKFLFDAFKPASAIDFGCGIGKTLYYLNKCGCDVLGIEGSKEAIEFSEITIKIHDLSKPIKLNRKFDLSISTEVAEHLPESAADQFINNIVSHTHSVCFFSAAVPGQKGTGHINCQPKHYWEQKFKQNSFQKSKALEFLAKIALYPLIWDCYWIKNNFQIFVSKEKKDICKIIFNCLPKFILFSFWWRFKISKIGGSKLWLPKI